MDQYTIFYKDQESGKLSYEYDEIQKLLKSGEFSWKDLISGFNKKCDTSKFNINNNTIYELHELYELYELYELIFWCMLFK
jgi:CTP:phosphocholine cytidylyltransferase-like protein